MQDGNGPAFAKEDRFAVESLSERPKRGPGIRARGRNKIGGGTLVGFDFESDGGRAMLFEERADGLDDFGRILVRNQTDGELGDNPEVQRAYLGKEYQRIDE